MSLTNFVQTNPKLSIILISLLVSILITVIRYFTVDKNKMKEIREKQKKLREEMKQYKNNPEKMMEINKKMLEDFPEQMKQSFKPMIITIIPIIILFGWMKSIYVGTSIASTWIWWYIGASIIFSILLNKIFGMQ